MYAFMLHSITMDTQSPNKVDVPENSIQQPVAPPSETTRNHAHAQSSEMKAPQLVSSSLPIMSSQAQRSPSCSISSTPQRQVPLPTLQLPEISSQELSSRSAGQGKNTSSASASTQAEYSSSASNQPEYISPYAHAKQPLPSAISGPLKHAAPGLDQHHLSVTPTGPSQGQSSTTFDSSWHQPSPTPGPSHHYHSQQDTAQMSLRSSIESYANDLEEIIRKGTIGSESDNKRIRGPNLTRGEKLTLAKLCNEYSSEYYFGNWGKFWIKIGIKLKEATGREHKAVQSSVERWIKIRQTKLFEQKMESGTEEERNDFMEAIDKFIDCWQHSHDKAADRTNTKKTREEESHNVRQARHDIMMGNAADEGIEIEDDNSPDENTPPGLTNKQKKYPTAEDRMADSFDRIAEYLVSSDDKGEGHQGEKGRKRHRSESESPERENIRRRSDSGNARTEMLAQMMTQMTEMSRTLLRIDKRLEAIEKNRKRQLQ